MREVGKMFDFVFIIVLVMVIAVFALTFFMIFKVMTSKNPTQQMMNDLTSNQNIEQMEKMATVMGKVAVNMAKEMNPEYKSLKCPNCGASLTDNVEVCEYCNAPLTKVVGQIKK